MCVWGSESDGPPTGCVSKIRSGASWLGLPSQNHHGDICIFFCLTKDPKKNWGKTKSPIIKPMRSPVPLEFRKSGKEWMVGWGRVQEDDDCNTKRQPARRQPSESLTPGLGRRISCPRPMMGRDVSGDALPGVVCTVCHALRFPWLIVSRWHLGSCLADWSA